MIEIKEKAFDSVTYSKRLLKDSAGGNLLKYGWEKGSNKKLILGSKFHASNNIIVRSAPVGKTAKGKIVVRGSSLKADNKALFVAGEGSKISIEDAHTQSATVDSGSASAFFEFFKHADDQREDVKLSVGTHLKGKSNLKLVSKEDIIVRGSQLESDGNVDAKGDAKFEAGKSVIKKCKSKTHTTSFAEGSADGDEGQVRGTIGINQKTTGVDQTDTKSTGSSVSGTNVNVNSQTGKVTTEGTRFTAKTKDENINVNGKKGVEDKAVRNTRVTKKIEGNAQYAFHGDVGFDKTGIAVGVKKKIDTTTVEETTHTDSSYNAGNKIVRKSKEGAVIDQAADFNAKKVISEGTEVRHDSVKDTRVVAKDSETVEVEVGVSINTGLGDAYRNTREGAEGISKNENVASNANKLYNGVEGFTRPYPDVGIDANVKYKKFDERKETVTGRGGNINARQVVDVATRGDVIHRGTNINADEAIFKARKKFKSFAVYRTGNRAGKGLDVDINARLATQGKDVRVDADGRVKVESARACSRTGTGSNYGIKKVLIISTGEGIELLGSKIKRTGEIAPVVILDSGAGSTSLKSIKNIETARSSETDASSSISLQIGKKGKSGGSKTKASRFSKKLRTKPSSSEPGKSDSSKKSREKSGDISIDVTVASANSKEVTHDGVKIDTGGSVTFKGDGDVNLEKTIISSNAAFENKGRVIDHEVIDTETSDEKSTTVSIEIPTSLEPAKELAKDSTVGVIDGSEPIVEIDDGAFSLDLPGIEVKIENKSKEIEKAGRSSIAELQ